MTNLFLFVCLCICISVCLSSVLFRTLFAHSLIMDQCMTYAVYLYFLAEIVSLSPSLFYSCALFISFDCSHVCLIAHASVCTFVYLFFCLSVCSFVCLSVCLCLSVARPSTACVSPLNFYSLNAELNVVLFTTSLPVALIIDIVETDGKVRAGRHTEVSRLTRKQINSAAMVTSN